jgi:hypothetical protein
MFRRLAEKRCTESNFSSVHALRKANAEFTERLMSVQSISQERNSKDSRSALCSLCFELVADGLGDGLGVGC